MPWLNRQISVVRQIDMGHRVLGHEGKCRFLHGHTYTIKVEIWAQNLEGPGFILDFGDVKAEIDKWDHRLLLWSEDQLRFGVDVSPLMEAFGDPREFEDDREGESGIGVVRVPFNPTAEKMAEHLCSVFKEMVKQEHKFIQVHVSETESTEAIHSWGYRDY